MQMTLFIPSSQSSHWFESSVIEIESNFPDDWTPSVHKDGNNYAEHGQSCPDTWLASHTVALSHSSLCLVSFRLHDIQDEMEQTIILLPFTQMLMLEGWILSNLHAPACQKCFTCDSKTGHASPHTAGENSGLQPV